MSNKGPRGPYCLETELIYVTHNGIVHFCEDATFKDLKELHEILTGIIESDGWVNQLDVVMRIKE